MKIDGKDVKYYLFCRYSRVMLPGSIPVDRKEREIALNMSEQARFLVNVQVEAFSKDHAIARLMEAWPNVERRDWEFVCDLDDSHDIGAMGTKLKLNPLVMNAPRRMQ